MQELAARDVRVTDSFWSPRLTINAGKAIFHQWEQLEATGCIDNFRIAAYHLNKSGDERGIMERFPR